MYRDFQEAEAEMKPLTNLCPTSMPFNLSVVIDRCVANDESDWAFPKSRSAGCAKASNNLLCSFRLLVVCHFSKGFENCGWNLR